METVRFRSIGKQDIRFGSSSFRTVLADGSVVLLDEVPEFADADLIDAEANVSVGLDATSLAITFAAPTTGYRLEVSFNWNTTWWWSSKSTTGITINFGTPAPSAAKLDWAVYAVS